MKVWKDGKSEEIGRGELWVTDRSRTEEFKKCPRKGYYKYYWDGTGVESSFPAEDPEMGTACHEGLEGLLTGAVTVAEAGQLAFNRVMKGHGKVVLQQDPLLWKIAPEAAEMLLLEQATLCQVLVEAWGRRRMEDFAACYELLAVEEEINWGMEENIVCMSRLDGVCQDAKGGLYALEFKTTKQLETDDIEQLRIQPQNWTQCYAMWHRYGKKPKGLIYHELIKGKKYASKAKDAPPWKRYNTGLIRPYYNQQAGMGQVRPEFFSFERKANKGWEQVDIWEMMDVREWIDWLDEGLVKDDEGRNCLDRATIEPEVVEFREDKARRWLRAQVALEYTRLQHLGGMEEEEEGQKEEFIDVSFPLHEHSCYYYGYKCTFHDVCHGMKTIEDGLMAGQYQTRIPNHSQEGERDGI